MPAGRPKIFDTADEMQEAVDAYFASLQPVDDDGLPNGDPEPTTITGLALALDMTRETLVQYGRDEAFSDTVKKAKMRVELFLERRLYGQAPAGTIFNLKNNFGWKDQQDHKLSGDPEAPIAINFNGVPSGRG